MCFVNSDLCHLQHKLIGFITDMKSVYSAVRTGPLNKAVCVKTSSWFQRSVSLHCKNCIIMHGTENVKFDKLFNHQNLSVITYVCMSHCNYGYFGTVEVFSFDFSFLYSYTETTRATGELAK
jgi:hypothetical protein